MKILTLFFLGILFFVTIFGCGSNGGGGGENNNTSQATTTVASSTSNTGTGAFAADILPSNLNGR
ncbi:MAG: hypothetical protein HQM08_19235 [Candidatus Riflebacteria bacterium]|nr:hypothetical protein [Candidatus Riflebacteria bacterium]